MFRLRCTKCGKLTRSAARIRRCHQVMSGNGFNAKKKFYCWGDLEAAPLPKRARFGGSLDLEIEHTQARLNAAIAKVKSAVALVDRWQKRLSALNRKRAEQMTHPPEAPGRMIADLEA